jgi:flagellar motor switch protein FliG
MPFKAGPKEAAKLLAGLSIEQRRKVLEEIAGRDPEMAELLAKMVVVFEDLRFITVKMLQELLREIKIDDLALGLRIASPELKNHLLSNVSRSLRTQIEDVLLGPPKPVSKVEEAQERVMLVVRAKVDRGELILRAGGEELV